MRKRAIAQIITCSILVVVMTFVLIGCTAFGITHSIVSDTLDSIENPIKKSIEITEKAVEKLPVPEIRFFGCAPVVTFSDRDVTFGTGNGIVPNGYIEGSTEYDTVPKNLEIDWAAGAIYVAVSADVRGVSVSEYAGKIDPSLAGSFAGDAVPDGQMMISRMQGDTLKIEQFRQGSSWIGVHDTYQKTLVVALPETMLDRLKIDSAAVDVCLQKIQVDRLDLNAASGKVQATACAFGHVEIDAAATETTFTECSVNRLDLDTASGKTLFDLVNTPEKLDVDSASANITVRLPADAAFTVKISSISGRSDIDGAFGSLSMQNGKTVVNGGGATFDFDMMSGSVTIEAKQGTAQPSGGASF